MAMNLSGISVGRRHRSAQVAGIMSMLGCALLWSTSGMFIKLIDWQPFAIASGRSVVAAIFLWMVIRKPRFTLSFPQIISAAAYAATLILFVYANKKTTAANAILLQYGAPVYVAILGFIVLKEKPRLEHLFALLAVIIGMLIFFSESLSKGNLLGDIIAAITGVTFATNIVFLRKLKDSSPVDALFLGHIFTAVIAGGLALTMPAPVITAKSVITIAAMGVFQIGVPAVLFSYGIKKITALESILTAVIEPLVNPLWVYLATKEVPGPRAMAGGAVIVAAVLISSLITVRRAAKVVQ